MSENKLPLENTTRKPPSLGFRIFAGLGAFAMFCLVGFIAIDLFYSESHVLAIIITIAAVGAVLFAQGIKSQGAFPAPEEEEQPGE